MTFILMFLAALGAPEQSVELHRGHHGAVCVREVRHVHAEGAVVLQVDQVLHDGVAEAGLAVGRQAHQLVLAAVHLEAREIGEGRVEQPQRVRKAQLLQHADLIAAPVRDTAGGPLSHAVHGDDGGLLERRGEEGAGGVRFVVLEKVEAGGRLEAAGLERVEDPWLDP